MEGEQRRRKWEECSYPGIGRCSQREAHMKGKRADEMNEVQMERKRALMEEGSTVGKEEGTDERRKCRWKGRGH